MSTMARVRRADVTAVPLDPVLDFMRLLWRIEHALQATSKRMETELGLTGPQRLALRVIGRFPGISAGDLAGILHLHPSTMTGVIQRLVEKGLLNRQRDPADSRRMQLQVRPRASALQRVARGTVEHAVARALRRAPAPRIRQARMLLGAVADELDAETQTGRRRSRHRASIPLPT